MQGKNAFLNRLAGMGSQFRNWRFLLPMAFISHCKSRKQCPVCKSIFRTVLRCFPKKLVARGQSTPATPCASPPPRPSIFSNYFFLVVHHPVNWDDRHLLAHAMASDFTVARQVSQREQLFFRYYVRIPNNGMPNDGMPNLALMQEY
jgi:hypothetical protein